MGRLLGRAAVQQPTVDKWIVIVSAIFRCRSIFSYVQLLSADSVCIGVALVSEFVSFLCAGNSSAAGQMQHSMADTGPVSQLPRQLSSLAFLYYVQAYRVCAPHERLWNASRQRDAVFASRQRDAV